ncbi:serine carboxypeptidase [Ancylostoma caninum]|uniref:Serine carboxypeptidase n=1 Tax=Ancylostoma caninum TaxID=29170 RepID=A0A368G3Z2_ANCCA|nr:serine carboxypeptidase [Ancylostoma caninum]
MKLTESRSSPGDDPLVVWFNGGPGCSSVAGLFEELGPFYVNFDGSSLYENVYAWNTKANVLYLESPIGVGFSYDTTHDYYTTANDDQTAAQNYAALKDFFNRFHEFIHIL